MQNDKKLNIQNNNKNESDSVKADKAIELLRFNVNITLFIIIKFLILENKCKKCVWFRY